MKEIDLDKVEQDTKEFFMKRVELEKKFLNEVFKLAIEYVVDGDEKGMLNPISLDSGTMRVVMNTIRSLMETIDSTFVNMDIFILDAEEPITKENFEKFMKENLDGIYKDQTDDLSGIHMK
jgi:hypothetical protein